MIRRLVMSGLIVGLMWPGTALARTAGEWLQRGLSAYRAGQYNRAVTCFSQVIELRPRFAPAHNDRGSAFLMIKRYDLAIRDFGQAILLNPKFAAAFHNRGLAHSAKGMHWRAIGDYSRAVELRTDYAEALNNRGYAYARLKLYRRAKKDYEGALRIRPNFELARNNLAQVTAILKKIQAERTRPKPPPAKTSSKPKTKPVPAVVAKKTIKPSVSPKPVAKPVAKPAAQPAPVKITPEPVELSPAERSRYERSVKRLSAKIKKNQRDAQAYYLRCYARRKLGKYRLAVADCTRAIELKPKWTLAYVGRGVVFRSLGQYQKALDDYDRAVKLSPRLALPWGGRAWLHVTARDPKFKDPGKALRAARKAARYSDYQNGNILDTLARALLLNGRYSQALGWAQRALNRDPRHKTWQKTLELIRRGQAKHYRTRIDTTSRIISVRPQNAAALIERCQLFIKVKKFRPATADCRRATKIAPQNALGWLFLAVANREAGQYGDAVRLYRKARQKGAPAAIISNGLAWLYLTAKAKRWRHKKKALSLARRAVTLSRYRNGFFLDTLARAQYQNGLQKKARASAARAVALDPDNATWRQTLDMVRGPGRRSGKRRR
ncbi:MAG: tetratricopeptide repeat protein [Proteobacteria bacterium]|nr:tetratricopeptide repeat protein [Pseudomonadota bacterium]